MRSQTFPDRLGRFAGLAVMVAAALTLTHSLVFLTNQGPGPAFATAMRRTGHDGYWSSLVLAVVVVSAAMLAVSVWQYRRVAALAAAAARGQVGLPGGQFADLLRLLVSLWRTLALTTVGVFLLQENLEHLIAGAGLPGLGVLGLGDYAWTVPIAAAVTLAISLVGALYRWRRAVLVARLAAGRSTFGRPLPAPRPRRTSGDAVLPIARIARQAAGRAPPLPAA